MAVDRNGLAVLTRDECLERLRSCRVGRVAVSVDALPFIVPVDYDVADDGVAIVLRTGVGAGGKVDAALRGAVVAFEVDCVDPDRHRGWSVLVTGTAVDRGGGHFELSADLVSGRLIQPVPLATPA